MKQQVSPAAIGVCVVILVVVLAFFGYRALSPPAATDAKPSMPATARPTQINGHAVPPGVPYDYFQHPPNQAPGGGPAPGGAAPGHP